MYESECRRCNGPDGWKTRDKGGLEDKRDVPSIYVGETCRSLHERSKEHWRDANTMSEESHMLQHQQEVHNDIKENTTDVPLLDWSWIINGKKKHGRRPGKPEKTTQEMKRFR